jgi:hypothetical protein
MGVGRGGARLSQGFFGYLSSRHSDYKHIIKHSANFGRFEKIPDILSFQAPQIPFSDGDTSGIQML